MRVCPEGGWLVDATFPFPTDPSEYHHPFAPDTVGCNRLRCAACGEAVEQAVENASRRYRCACTTYLENTLRTAGDPDLDPGEVSLPWRCEGHPSATLPVDVDGVVVDEATDVAPVVAQALAGDVPGGARVNARGMPAGWLARLYSRLDGLPQGDAVGQAIADSLARDVGRGTALRFYAGAPRAAGFEAVLGLSSRLTDSWPTPYFDKEWQQTPLQAILPRLVSVAGEPDDLDRGAAEALRTALRDKHPAADSDWFAALGAVDRKALLGEAADWARLRGAYVGMMLDGLVDSDRADLALLVGYTLVEARAGRSELKKWVAKPEHRRRSYAVLLQKRLDTPRKKR